MAVHAGKTGKSEGDQPASKRPAKVSSPGPEVTRAFLARVLGVDVRSIKNFVDGGMPKAQRGRFELAIAVQWYVDRERAAARASKGLNDLDRARERKTVAEARSAELDLEAKEGGVIPLAVHEARLRERIETVAGNVKAIGRYHPEVKAALTDEAADALLDRMSDEILAELFESIDVIE